MTIEQAMRDYIRTEVIDRFYMSIYPPDVVFPAGRMQRLSGDPIVTHDGDSGDEDGRFQVSCHAKTYFEAKELQTAIKEILSAYSGALGEIPNARVLVKLGPDLYEAESKLHHHVLDVNVISSSP
jgi:hypothetical protein